MIKTFLFDLGNVLLFFSHEKRCQQMGALCGLSAEQIRQLVFVPEAHLKYERGEWSEAEFHAWFEQQVGCKMSLLDLRRAAADIFVPNQTMFPVLSPDEMAGHYSENDVAQAVRLGRITGPDGAWDRIAQRGAAFEALEASDHA